MALIDHVHNAGSVITVMDNKMDGLHKEIEELKVGVDLEAIAIDERRVADLLAKVERHKGEFEEATQQQEVMDKELNDSCILLGDVQRQLKDVRARNRVMEDDLLK
ncbi:hypothetical protein B296_00031250 [Ensete ventricosum]|uniref:Uncharacterized protein n=1 Tax=Ensete ventricosum TaxID=4639 RepID=A0A426Y1H7_ENSVE|nr:hypothetical protein B296_00031250 [Ensete ventricosum]